MRLLLPRAEVPEDVPRFGYKRRERAAAIDEYWTFTYRTEPCEHHASQQEYEREGFAVNGRVEHR